MQKHCPVTALIASLLVPLTDWGLRDYGHAGQIGQEDTPEEYVETLVSIFDDLKIALKDTGTLWLNLGDSYIGYKGENYLTDENKKGSNLQSKSQIPTSPKSGTPQFSGLKPKNLVGIPWMVAFALRSAGYYLRSDIIWHKPNGMPESVTDRPTKAHEYLFLLSKSPKYYYDGDAITELANYDGRKQENMNGSEKYDETFYKPMQQTRHKEDMARWANRNELGQRMRNKRTVWTIPTKPYKEAHFAVFPPALVIPCLLAGCPPNGLVLDPFFGSGTVGKVALENGRNYLGVELNEDYIKLAHKRLQATNPALFAL